MNKELMTKEEIKRRLEEGENPFDLSIEKYERLLIADFDGISPDDLNSGSCACCVVHHRLNDRKCTGCEIATVTGKSDCIGIPWGHMKMAFNKAVFEKGEKKEEAKQLFYEWVEIILLMLKEIKRIVGEDGQGWDMVIKYYYPLEKIKRDFNEMVENYG